MRTSTAKTNQGRFLLLPWLTSFLLLAGALCLQGCLNLEELSEHTLYYGVPCEEVGPAMCEELDEQQNTPFRRAKMCTPCAENYDWTQGEEAQKRALETLSSDADAVPLIRTIDVQSKPLTHTSGSVLDLHFIPAPNDSPLEHVTILYNHDSYGNVEYYIPRLRALRLTGANILIWDPPGYGKSRPTQYPSPELYVTLAKAVREQAQTRFALPLQEIEVEGETRTRPHQFLIYGMGLGAAGALAQAKALPACGVILEAPMPSAQSLITQSAGVSLPAATLAPWRPFNNIEAARTLQTPLLTFAAGEDKFYPTQDVRRLHDAASSESRRFVQVNNAPHDLVVETDPELYLQEIRDFVSSRSSCVLGE